MDVQLRTGVPCAFGVLTVETMEQALARAGGDKRDQGRHAAEAVLTMAKLRGQLEAQSRPARRRPCSLIAAVHVVGARSAAAGAARRSPVAVAQLVARATSAG